MKFTSEDLKKLWSPAVDSKGEDNGQITIVGGSELFSGAPIFSLVAASRLVDMVFLATPDQDKQIAENVALFSKLRSVIWVPRENLDEYINKSDAVLIGPGLMRYRKNDSENDVLDGAGTDTKMLTKYLLSKFPQKRWVIDGGSLQVMDAAWIPKGAVLTPNSHEFDKLFGDTDPVDVAKKYSCTVVLKGPVSVVTDGVVSYEIEGGNAGLTKGGTGDTLAGIIVGLLAKNEPVLAAAAGSLLIKKTAEFLYDQVGFNFNADDVSENVFKVWRSLS